jgi:hypothetical protein
LDVGCTGGNGGEGLALQYSGGSTLLYDVG